MTLSELAADVQARLNLSSAESDTRVKANLNAAYRKVTSSIGLQTSRRSTDTQNTAAADPQVTFDLAKVERVYIAAAGKRQVLIERTYDALKELNVTYATTGLPRQYAIERADAATVTIILEPIPSGVFEIKADGDQNASTLGENDSPTFAADFHDILVYDACRIEWLKKDKLALSKQAEADYQQRLSDLRYYIAKSNSLAIVQNSRRGWGPRRGGYRLV